METKTIGIGMAVTLGLQLILARVPVLSNYSFWAVLALAVYLIFIKK